ncbi:flavin reductase family protein [Agrobacterium tumefaciens]|uniref:Flavin reductase family protein n=1 Tax=Agrobacterium tumefaciens TaxID=358 RepID=A0AAE6EHP4_AGRTU|nr:flavin reductase family protein [Agrobacterium tumefaciens]QCL82248.1 flavin reductase family protein [Agrobacterium tumefaciens]
MINHAHVPLKTSTSPTISPREFKDAMAGLAFTVAVATTSYAGERIGRTITSFMPLSAEPPLLMISIDASSRMVDLIAASQQFSVTALSRGQEEIADVFAGKGNLPDRFSVGSWDVWPSGSPRLAKALLSMDCELVGSIDVADHILFVGTIIEARFDPLHKALLWSERNYKGAEVTK